MAFKKALAAVAALSLIQFTQAWHIEMPPCIDEFQPFVYSGCYQDGSPQALIYKGSGGNKGMTIEKCVAECKGNGFRYAGLKYYGNCYCGGTVNGPLIDEGSCNLKCDGDKTQTCGGNSALSVYQDPTFEKEPSKVDIANYSPIGCYTDGGNDNGRTLSWPQKMDTATFTPSKCLTACRDNGYAFAGLEFGQECWCGSVLANATSQVDISECNSDCKGDKTQKCGGRLRLSLYVAKELQSLQPCGYKPPTNSVTTLSASTTTSTPVDGTTTSSTPVTDKTTTTSADDKPTTTTSVDDKPTTTSADDKPTTTTSVDDKPTTTSADDKPTTTSSEAVVTTTSTTSSVTAKTTTSSAPVTTSTAPTTTTSPIKTTTTSSAAQCTTTITKPNDCEYKCGNWCAPSIPDWDNKDDCLGAYKTCAKSVTSCFKKAGWPGVLDCFDFSKWCGGVKDYCYADTCKSKGKWCNKKSCFDKNPPTSPKPPQVTTSVYPCPVSTTTSTTAVPTTCAPEPTNVCKQPTNNKYGYAPGKPVGDVDLPLLGCNDLLNDWKVNPFKLYLDEDTRKCKGYKRPDCSNACKEACDAQYDDCKDVYAESCKRFGWKSYFHFKREADYSENEKRFFNLFGSGGLFGGAKDDYNKANEKCTAQWKDCLAVNKGVSPGSRCSSWGTGL